MLLFQGSWTVAEFFLTLQLNGLSQVDRHMLTIGFIDDYKRVDLRG